ncbi:MAG: S8 family peptidase [Actinoplanes sp.]
MKKQWRKYGAGAAVLGAVVGTAALTLPAEPPNSSTGAWRPATSNLATAPARLLPPVISSAHPVRVVSTAVGRDGRPVATVRTATDRAAAAALVTRGQRAPGAIAVELDVPVTVAAVDPLRSAQWDLDRIRTESAWQRSTGAGVTVAVVDSGVEASHPDLAGRVLPGADFITGLEGVSIDPHGHGTHVAGTIAALAGNGAGIAGMAPDARILPVRVLGDNGSGYMSDVANGIVYATDRGADVINLSVGATSQVGAVSNAVAYARGHGVVVVAAAGNTRGAGSPTSYPAADEGVIAVSATDSADKVASYSTRGNYVDVSAPGSDIVSTYRGASYGRMSGTSMAAPHVSALAALLKGYDRTLTPDAVEQAIVTGAVDLGVPGRDADFGAGRIDAAATLAAVSPATSAPTTVPATPSVTPSAAQPSTAPTTPSPTTPAPTTPAPTTPAPNRQPGSVYLIKSGSAQLTVAIREPDGQTVEVQRRAAGGWTTIHTYVATVAVRLDGLSRGSYRVIVPDSPRFLRTVTVSVQL